MTEAAPRHIQVEKGAGAPATVRDVVQVLIIRRRPVCQRYEGLVLTPGSAYHTKILFEDPRDLDSGDIVNLEGCVSVKIGAPVHAKIPAP
jgi:hypothetical protein